MRTLALATFLAAALPCSAAQVMLDFESDVHLTTTGPFESVTAIESSGFLIFAAATAGGGGISLQPQGGCWPGNGTVSLSVPDYAAPVIRHAGGRPFTLLRLDVAEYSCLYTGPQTIRFIAGFANGGTALWETQLDGVSDFGGPLTDYQTLELPATLAGAEWLRMEGNMSTDNLVLSVNVPESSTSSLTALALLTSLMHRRAGCRRG